MSHTVRTTAKTALAVIVVVLAAAGLLLRANVPQVPSNTWAATGDMNEPRAGAASTLLYDGQVLVTGGMNDTGVTATAERYSPDGGRSWRRLPCSSRGRITLRPCFPTGTSSWRAVSAPDGAASAEVYDPANNAWHPVAPMHVARSGQTATALFDGRVVIAEGRLRGRRSIRSKSTIRGAETFELVATPMSVARTGHAAAQTYDDLVVIAGGYDGAAPLDSIDIFDPFFNTVTAAPPLGLRARASRRRRCSTERFSCSAVSVTPASWPAVKFTILRTTRSARPRTA